MRSTYKHLEQRVSSVGDIQSNVSILNVNISSNVSSLNQKVSVLEAAVPTKAPLVDPVFTSNIEVSGNAYIGNLTVGGQLTYLSTDNTVLKDAIVQLANTNTASTLDMGFVLTRPRLILRSVGEETKMNL